MYPKQIPKITKVRSKNILFAALISFTVMCLLISMAKKSEAFDLTDLIDIGSAYMAHLYMHEMGHHVVANEVGAEGNKIGFMVQKDGQLYPGLATYTNIPAESKLSYAVGGEKMAGITFEYALMSYREKPTTFNKALMFFSTVDFVAYTFMANYINPDDPYYDPNLIRKETGCSKELLMGIVLTKALANSYRIYNEDARLIPEIRTDHNSAAFVLNYRF
jgi:hypothetical protein